MEEAWCFIELNDDFCLISVFAFVSAILEIARPFSLAFHDIFDHLAWFHLGDLSLVMFLGGLIFLHFFAVLPSYLLLCLGSLQFSCLLGCIVSILIHHFVEQFKWIRFLTESFNIAYSNIWAWEHRWNWHFVYEFWQLKSFWNIGLGSHNLVWFKTSSQMHALSAELCFLWCKNFLSVCFFPDFVLNAPSVIYTSCMVRGSRWATVQAYC